MEKTILKVLVTFTILPAANAGVPIDSNGNSSDSEVHVGLLDVSEVEPLIFDKRIADGVHSKLLCDIYLGGQTSMNSQSPAKTLSDEIAEVIAAEQLAADELSKKQRQEEEKLKEAAHRADTLRAKETIATIREKVLAPDRANWKPLMNLSESQVFVPGTHNDSDILLRDGAAKQVRDYCRDNGIEVKISAERRDGQYSISSATGIYIMSIRVK